MRIDRLGYRPFRGEHVASWRGFWPIARTSFRLILRRKLFYAFLGLGLLNYLVHAALIYFITEFSTQIPPQSRALAGIVRRAAFSGQGESYRTFIFLQSFPVMLVLAYAGSTLLSADFRHRALVFYLSRPISRVHYFAGKFLPLFAIGATLTLVPALALFLQYGAFTSDLSYWRDHQRIFWAILASGTLISVSCAVVLLGIAARFQRTVPILLVWGGLFVFLPFLAGLLRTHFESLWGYDAAWYWALLDFWKNLQWISNGLFGIRPERYIERSIWSGAVLAVVVAICVATFWRCVRGSEVVR